MLIAITGLVLLALSLVDTHQADHPPGWTPVLLWLGGSTAAALVLARFGAGLARGASLGLAAGLLFAGGDISAKLVVYGGIWLVAVGSLIVCYALGTSVLQGAFQHGDALTGAGLATLATNAVPIAAGFVVFGEQLPGGARGVLQLVAFASLVGSAVLLARTPHPLPGGRPRHFQLAPGTRLGRSPMNPNATHTRQTSRTATPGPIFSRILVGIDGSEAGFEACRQVARLADQDSEIDAVAVVHVGPAVASALDAAHVVDVLEREAEEALEHALAILGGRAHKRYLDGFVTSALLAELQRFDATLIALGTHEHRRTTEIIFGGVAGEVLHKAPCSVLIARPRPTETFPREIVVGHDGSPQAESALAVAHELEHRFGSTVRVITSLAGKHVNQDLIRERTDAEVVAQHPVVALVEAARDADLLVVGSRGLHGLKALGSVSERVAHDASCSVLVVRIAPPSQERSC